jgi:hypothetical protein
MIMSKKSAYCFVTSRQQADQIVNHLRTESFSNNGISVLFSDPVGAVAGVGTGTLANTPLGWIAGIGSLTIPGFGPAIAAGPVAGALSGAAGGGIVGGLVSLGLSEVEAKRCEGKVRDGNLLILVHTEDLGDIARAKDIFNQARGQEICTAGGAATKDDTTSELMAAA